MDGGRGANPSSLAETETGRRVRIRYREVDLKSHPDKRQFWYRLANRAGETLSAGVTKERSFDWVPAKAGTYSFEVQAIDRDLNYSEPVRVMMQVTLPWHANGWILVPIISAFAGLIVWAVVARSLYVKKSREAFLMRERVRIARDLHDHLGARLTHLAMVGDLVRQQLGHSGSEQVLAGRLSESARELTRTMGEVIWATDPDKDTLRSFALFVTRYAERFFVESALRLRFDIPDELPDIAVPAEVRNSLFMVTKEALNNVAKHANASELRIKLELVDRELRLCFEDNGRGFSPSQDRKEGHGLTNMQNRLRDLGGECRIESAPGEGTTIHVSFRLPKR
jgi:signal transduction histidine kinase